MNVAQSDGDEPLLESLEPEYIGGFAPAIGLGNAQLVRAAQFVVSGAMSVAIVKYFQENPVFPDARPETRPADSWENDPIINGFNNELYSQPGSNHPKWVWWIIGGAAAYELYENYPTPEIPQVPQNNETIIVPYAP